MTYKKIENSTLGQITTKPLHKCKKKEKNNIVYAKYKEKLINAKCNVEINSLLCKAEYNLNVSNEELNELRVLGYNKREELRHD